jgi:predicted methyltransferase
MYFFEKNDEVDDCDEDGNEAAVQMKWLESTLEKYSKKGGDHMVYIMGHVPPIDDDGSKLYKKKCYKKYFNLLGKYGDIIAGHFTGHTNSKLQNRKGRKNFFRKIR